VPTRLAAALAAILAAAPAGGAEPGALPGPWPWTFPILGRAAVERGADLPLPLGFSVVGNWQRDDIVISDVLLGLGQRPNIRADFLDVRRLRNDAYAVLGRVDLWVLPMLDVYVLGGPIWTRTRVDVRQPFGLVVESDAHGANWGGGGTAGIGNRWGFITLDANVTWTKLDILSRPQVAFMVDPRVGQRFQPLDGVHLSAWVGGTYQTMVNRSVGSVPLGGSVDFLALQQRGYDQAWFDSLSPAQQEHFNQLLVDGARAAATPGSRIYYDLQVKPREPWSMNSGFQAEVGRSWFVIGEASFFGSRRGALLSAGYRLGL